MDDEKFVYVRGVLSIMRPDIRQYKQQSIEITFNQEVVVKVPLEFAVFDNEETEIFALTPEGVFYVQNEFEKLFNAEIEKVETEWDVKPKETEKKSDDGWDEVLEEVSEKVGKALDKAQKKMSEKEVDEDWGDDPTFTDDESEEDSNKPDEEVWNEDDEEWK